MSERKQHTKSHRDHLQIPTSIKDGKANITQSLAISTRARSERTLSDPKLTHSRKNAAETSKHSTKSWEQYSKELNTQSLPLSSPGIAFDLRGLALDSQSSNSFTAPASSPYAESLQVEDEALREYGYSQSTYFGSGEPNYPYRTSATATSREGLNSMERYLTEDVTERYSIFSVQEAQPSFYPYNYENSDGSGTRNVWRYSQGN